MRFSNRIDFPKDVLKDIWQNFEWEKAEKELFLLQQKLTRVALQKNFEGIKKFQNKIISSLEARALAVRKVSEQMKSAPGIDGVK